MGVCGVCVVLSVCVFVFCVCGFEFVIVCVVDVCVWCVWGGCVCV